ncbi:P-loop NTPase fold protein [Micromonospora sp. NPDC005305]|uniref:P-loop NTPase fold protein n=1 Tax=Micromonospora sp. NPDC005305 TaxID=3156875 RepID=UPI0033AE1948
MTDNWRVRVADSEGRVLGVGVLIDRQQVITLDYVVRELSTNDAPTDALQVLFVGPGPGRAYTATLADVHRDEGDEAVGIAVLRLVEPAPPDVLVAPLGRFQPDRHHRLRVFGFPPGYSEGVWIRCEAAGFSGGGGRWVQLDLTTAAKLGPGFAGAGVMADDGVVVGLVVAAASGGAFGWMVPMEEIARLWPEFADLLGTGGLVTVPPPAEMARPTGGPVGKITTKGFGDRPARVDALSRLALVETLVELLDPPEGYTGRIESGPTVIAVEGSWGTGKSSVIGMANDRLRARYPADARVDRRTRHRWANRRLRVWDADVALGAWASLAAVFRRIHRRRRSSSSGVPPRVVTANFNPWSFQTSEQVWAGLTDAIIRAADPVLCPDETVRDRARERYWFGRNVRELDRRRLQKTLRQRVLSPLLRLAVFALPVPLLAQLLRAPTPYGVGPWKVSPVDLSLWTVACLLALGLTHTAWRYLTHPAAALLPVDLFTRPVVSGAVAAQTVGSAEAVLHDPYYRARSGYLYLVQHDVFDVLAAVRNAGSRLVVCIDDLDRCSPRTTADVFEAVNVFAAQSYPTMRFLIGLDASAVAAHLDAAYDKLAERHAKEPFGADPTVGWSYLRKLIQLPVIVPRTTPAHVLPVLRHLLGPVRLPDAEDGNVPLTADPPSGPPEISVATDSGSGRNAEARTAAVAALEAEPSVRERLAERLAAQPDLSVREAKRILTVWQFYVRVLERPPGADGDPVVRSRDLVVLAEVVARWPAYQRRLHQRIDGRHGLRLLAEAADDEDAWARTAERLGFGLDDRPAFLADLRDLLLRYDGAAVAALAERLT